MAGNLRNSAALGAGSLDSRKVGSARRSRAIFIAILSLTAACTVSFGLGQVWESLDQRARRQTSQLEQSASWVRSALRVERPEISLLPSTTTSEIFRGLKTFELSPLKNGVGGMRAGIVEETGAFIAHSIPHLAGTSLGETRLRSDLIRPLFEKKWDAYTRKTLSVDGLEVWAFAERLGQSRFVLLVELPSEGVTSQEIRALSTAILSGLFQSLAVVAALGVLFFLSRLTQRTLVRLLGAGADHAVSAPLKERPAVPPLLEESPALRESRELSKTLQVDRTDSLAGPVSWVLPDRVGGGVALEPSRVDDSSERETDLLDHFEWEAAHLRDSQKVARRLVETAATLCQSPALFFRFDAAIQAAFLEAQAGWEEANWEPSANSLSFPIDSKSLGRILDQSLKGGMESLSQFTPLSTLVLAHLGVSHFDAWAITGFSHLGRAARSPRLLGVLVILRAGVESHARRKSLGRMMRATGLIYENTILSQ